MHGVILAQSALQMWHDSAMADKKTTKDEHLTMRAAIQKIAVGPDRGRDIERAHAQSVMQQIMAGHIDEVQTAVFLIAMRMKRESIDEFLGMFDALQQSLETTVADVPELFCLADPFDGYVRTTTMTPFIAPVLAACGMPSLMHGVESVGPKHGVTAHKVYALANIKTSLTVTEACSNIEQVGWTYIDQSDYAPQLYALESLRDRIVKRTALTTLERLLKPIKARGKTHFVLGYVHKAYPEIYAAVAKAAGYDTTLLLKGVEGGLAPALNKPLRQFFFEGDLPQDIDAEKDVIESHLLFEADSAALSAQGGEASAEQCLSIGRAVLAGRADGEYGQARASLSLAVAHILTAHGRSTNLPEAVVKVQNCLDNGSADECFKRLIHQ